MKGTLSLLLFLSLMGGAVYLKLNGSELIKNITPAIQKAKVEKPSITLGEIKTLSELTTSSQNNQVVVPVEQTVNLGQMEIGKTRLLYIAKGKVKAGINLDELKDEDFLLDEENKTLEIKLPPPQLLSFELDVNESKTFDYNRGTLNLGPDTAPTLIKEAQSKAAQEIKNTACKDEILNQANSQAKLIIKKLVSKNGLEVKVVTQEGKC